MPHHQAWSATKHVQTYKSDAKDAALQNLGLFDKLNNIATNAVKNIHNKLVDDKKNHVETPMDKINNLGGKLNNSWNANVCDNFCQRVPHYPPNYVNSKCPDHCMKANLTFKKVPY